MPSIKLKGKAQEVKSGFEPYDGPVPSQRGFYRAVLKKVQYKQNSKGSMGFNIIAELEAAKGDPKDHAQFDGYPMFIRSIITEAANGEPLKEGAQRNLDNFLYALDAGDDPNLVVDDGDIEDGVNVKKIGKTSPVGRVVNIDLGFEFHEGERRPTSQGIYKYKEIEAGKTSRKATVSASDLDEDDDLLEETEDDEEEPEPDEDFDGRKEELEAMGIPALRNILKSDYDLPTSGKKGELVERILDYEFGATDEAEEAEDDELDEEEDDELEEELDDEEDDEEELDDEESARRTELAAMDRLALRRILKAVAPEFAVKKSHTDADLVEAIIENEFGDETPF